MNKRPLAVLALGIVLLLAPGCPAFTSICKWTGLCGSAPMDLGTNDPIPPDFELSVDVRDQAVPPLDYTFTFDRRGRVDYFVRVRAPYRREQEGSIEITEDQLISLWKAVLAADFDDIPERYPSSGDGPNQKLGVQKYFVKANDTERRVEARYMTAAALDKIRNAILAVVPTDVIKASAMKPGPDSREVAKAFVADQQTHIFHRPDCPKLKDIPESRCEQFESAYDALNHTYQPCPDCTPMTGK